MRLSTAEIMSEKDMTEIFTETSTESPSVALKLTTEIENNNEKFDNVIISTTQGPLRHKTTQNPLTMTQTESTMTDYDLLDNCWTQTKKIENLHAMQKRDAK